jgi:hypothetical protein
VTTSICIVILKACLGSNNCKRFIQSEWAGNFEDSQRFLEHIERHAHHFGSFCEILKIFRTLFNNGWFMDYFVPEEKSYMRYIPEEFPINLRDWHHCIRGTGDEPQGWTCGHDVAEAIAELSAADEWVR